jgi:hypothetical protein
MAPAIDAALRQAGDPKFWGEVTITFRAGKPALIKTTQTTQLDDARNANENQRRY